MCHQLIMLAELDEHRYIAQCEHKTIHLGWDMTTFHFSQSSFLELAKALQPPFSDGEQLLKGQSFWFRVTRRRNGPTSLQIGQVELHVSFQDFLLLSQMMLRSQMAIEVRKGSSATTLSLYLAPLPGKNEASMN